MLKMLGMKLDQEESDNSEQVYNLYDSKGQK